MGVARVVMAAMALALGASVRAAEPDAALLAALRTITPAKLRATVETLSGGGPRLSGYPRNAELARWLEARFRSMGLRDVDTLPFHVTVPVQKEAVLEVDGTSVPLHAVWPNLVRTSTTPPGGLRGSLIDASDAHLFRFNGTAVRGSIVLLDFNSRGRWENAAMLGAAAAVFIGTRDLAAGELDKYRQVPLDMPRFWVDPDDGERLRRRAREGGQLEAVVRARVDWERLVTENVYGFVYGTDPEIGRDLLVVEASYDSISIIPSLAPGATQACGLAALMALAEHFAAHPPKRSMLFLASSGHAQAMGGVRHFFHAFNTSLGDLRSAASNARQEVERLEQVRVALAPVGELEARLATLRHQQALRRASPAGLFAWPSDEEVDALAQAVERLEATGDPSAVFAGAEAEARRNPGLMIASAAAALVLLLAWAVAAKLEARRALRRLLVAAAMGCVVAFLVGLTPHEEVVETEVLRQKVLERLQEPMHLRAEDCSRELFRLRTVARTGHAERIAELDALRIAYKRLSGREGYSTLEPEEETLFRPVVARARDELEGRLRYARQKLRIASGKLRLGTRLAGHVTEDLETVRDKGIYLFIGLDLSSKTAQLGAFREGWLYRLSALRHVTDTYSPLAERLEDIARDAEDSYDMARAEPRDPGTYARERLYHDVIRGKRGRPWHTYIPRMGFSSEVADLSGEPGITFATLSDERHLVDTPADTADRLDLPNLATQTRLILAMLDAMAADPDLVRLSEFPNGFGRVSGKLTMELTGRRTPDQPVPGAVATLYRGIWWSLVGARPRIPQITGPDGEFEFVGIATLPRAWWRWLTLDGYRLSRETGEVDMAINQAMTRNYPNGFRNNDRNRSIRPVLFPCRGVALYNLFDQRYFEQLRTLTVLDARRESQPIRYGMSKWWTSGVVFLEPLVPLKVVMSAGLRGVRLVLLNATEEEPEGVGYTVEQLRREPLVPLLVARDFYRLVDYRLGVLEDRGIRNRRLRDLHAEAGRFLEKAEAALGGYADVRRAVGAAAEVMADARPADVQAALDKAVEALDPATDYGDLPSLLRDAASAASDGKLDRAAASLTSARTVLGDGTTRYDKAVDFARSAWAYESRAYPDVQATINDTVAGVLFYVALLLPFAYCIERLFFCYSRITARAAATLGILAASIAVLWQIHPAFELAKNPFIVILAFFLLAMGGLTLTIILARFEDEMKKLERQRTGIEVADVSRASAFGAAFTLGISNMRRRKVRTALTAATLIILTFAIMSFTSTRTRPVEKEQAIAAHPTYKGVLIRRKLWAQMSGLVYGTLFDKYGQQRIVAPRIWRGPQRKGERSYIDLRSADGARTFTVKSLLGLSADERRLLSGELLGSPESATRTLVATGRWFERDDVVEILLPRRIAQSLGIRDADVGSATVQLLGIDFTVAGIFDGKRFEEFLDLNGEPISPVDWSVEQEAADQEREAAAEQESETGLDARELQYIHVPADEMAILPFATLWTLGGSLRSVAVALDPSKAPDDTLGPRVETIEHMRRHLKDRLTLTLYFGDEHGVYKYTAADVPTFQGLRNIFVPLVIAFLIVLNTMLGSVHERIREVGTYSAVGLAPGHISMLFMAEALGLATVSAVAGYLVSQTAVKILFTMGWMNSEQMFLNYSSMSTVGSLLVVILMVLVSTAYPARMVSRVASPDIERRWSLPPVVGNHFDLRLPYSLSHRDVPGLMCFLHRFVRAHEETSFGVFCVRDVGLAVHDGRIRLSFSAWLAPYDLGVYQRVTLRSEPTGEEGFDNVLVAIHRQSGEVTSWRRNNLTFLNQIRKQLLIWRAIGAAGREKYITDAAEQFGEAPPPPPKATDGGPTETTA